MFVLFDTHSNAMHFHEHMNKFMIKTKSKKMKQTENKIDKK